MVPSATLPPAGSSAFTGSLCGAITQPLRLLARSRQLARRQRINAHFSVPAGAVYDAVERARLPAFRLLHNRLFASLGELPAAPDVCRHCGGAFAARLLLVTDFAFSASSPERRTSRLPRSATASRFAATVSSRDSRGSRVSYCPHGVAIVTPSRSRLSRLSRRSRSRLLGARRDAPADAPLLPLSRPELQPVWPLRRQRRYFSAEEGVRAGRLRVRGGRDRCRCGDRRGGRLFEHRGWRRIWYDKAARPAVPDVPPPPAHRRRSAISSCSFGSDSRPALRFLHLCARAGRSSAAFAFRRLARYAAHIA